MNNFTQNYQLHHDISYTGEWRCSSCKLYLQRLVSPTSIHIEPVEMCEGLGLAFCEGSGA